MTAAHLEWMKSAEYFVKQQFNQFTWILFVIVLKFDT